MSYSLFFSSSSETPKIQMFLHLILSQESETVLSSFHSLYFILPSRSYFHRFIFQLTDSFFCFRYSVIPSRVFLISGTVLFVSVCLFFNSYRSLLIDCCTFSILLSRFLIIFTITVLNYFSGSLPISSSFIWTSVFLVCAFICAVFLCLFFFSYLLCLRSPFPRLQGKLNSFLEEGWILSFFWFLPS